MVRFEVTPSSIYFYCNHYIQANDLNLYVKTGGYEMAMKYNKFILFGDSITQFCSSPDLEFGLQPALQHLYSRKLDIINRGFSGYNSDHARLILPKILQQELNETKDNVKLMTIFFGTNDAFQIDDDINRIQGLGIEKYRENMTTIINMCLENNIRPIVIGPALHDNRLSRIGYVNRKRSLTNDATTCKRNHLYSKAAQEVAFELNVPFLDLWDCFRRYGNWTEEQLYRLTGNSNDDEYIDLSKLIYDGIHLSGEGYRVLYDELIKIIKQEFPDMIAENLPMNLPYWMDIDPNNLTKSLFGS